MPRDSTAYAALGLEPGADAAAVERAYKKLIKKHHPDRAGGDAKRAAEINRAYRELRPWASPDRDALEFNEEPPSEPRNPVDRLVLGGMGIVAGVGALLLAAGPIRPIGSNGLHVAGSPLPLVQAANASMPAEQMDQPLAISAIDAAAGQALRLRNSGDEMSMARVSDDCHGELRAHPSIRQLDRCAAFDDAVVQLQDRDPLRDKGPFSELAVTGRQWSAASALSSDYLAIDGRLDRIRQRVETVIAPEMPPIAN
jgi:hypothetical protein